jgi:hypothetical protein
MKQIRRRKRRIPAPRLAGILLWVITHDAKK